MEQSNDESSSAQTDVGAVLRERAFSGRDEMLKSIEAMRLAHLDSTSAALQAMNQFNHQNLQITTEPHDGQTSPSASPAQFMLDFDGSTAAISDAAEALSAAVAHTQLQVEAALQVAAQHMVALYGPEGSQSLPVVADTSTD